VEILIAGVLGTVTQTGEATHFQQDPILIPPKATAGEHSWFAVQTKPRHEKRVATELEEEEEKGVVAFLPLFSEVHQWSDRRRQLASLFKTDCLANPRWF
jgi:Transcription termination factor nusG